MALFDEPWSGAAGRDNARRGDARRGDARRIDARIIHRCEEPGRGHAERLLVLVDEVLAEAALALTALDAIVCSVGPGAFTGVRITVAAAQGLAFGANLPVVAVSTLEALALPGVAGGATRVLACLDARMNEVYWGCYGADVRRGVCALRPPAVSTAQAVLEALGSAAALGLSLGGGAGEGSVGVGLGGGGGVRGGETGWLGVGRGFAAQPLLCALAGLTLAPDAATALPDARDLARLGAARFAAGEAIDPAQLVPLYIRDKVAWTPAERAEQAARPEQAALPCVTELSQATDVIRAPEESRD